MTHASQWEEPLHCDFLNSFLFEALGSTDVTCSCFVTYACGQHGCKDLGPLWPDVFHDLGIEVKGSCFKGQHLEGVLVAVGGPRTLQPTIFIWHANIVVKNKKERKGLSCRIQSRWMKAKEKELRSYLHCRKKAVVTAIHIWREVSNEGMQSEIGLRGGGLKIKLNEI